jgi:tRNA (mo5U34)-methyltransferase
LRATTQRFAELTREEIAERVKSLGPWFHNLDLEGVQTAPEHFIHDYPRSKFARFEHALPADLTGRTVLDVGCNAGFYAMEMKRRGAERVVAIDSDEKYLAQARFAAEVNGHAIELRRLDVYDVGALREKFDLVLFMGVLYHLRHPLLALDLLHEHAVKDLLLFQTLTRGPDEVAPLERDYPFKEEEVFDQPGYPKLHFVEHEYAHDWTNWWVPNRACAEAMLRDAGFEVVAHPDGDVWMCRWRPTSERGEPRAVYPKR